MVAARLADMKQGARTDIASIEARSQSDAAEMLNVSRSAVQRAREVINDGAPELVAAVDRGAVSVGAALEAELGERRGRPAEISRNCGQLPAGLSRDLSAPAMSASAVRRGDSA